MVEEPIPRLGPVPWTVGDIARAVGVVIAIFIPILFVVMLAAVLIFGPEGIYDQMVILVLLLGLVLEGALFLGAWLFSVSKYRCGWGAFGFRSFDIKRALILVAVVLIASIAINFLYEWILTTFGVEHLQPMPFPPEYTQGAVNIALLSLLAVGVAPFVEEAFFRGFVFSGVGKRFGYGWGAVLSALLFALAHFQLGALVPIFLLGLLLAWLYWRTRSLWACILTHLAYNSIALLFMILFGW